MTISAAEDVNTANNTAQTHEYAKIDKGTSIVLYANEPPVHGWIALKAFNLLKKKHGENSQIIKEFQKYLPEDKDPYEETWFYGIKFVAPVIQGNTINGFTNSGIYVDSTSLPTVTGNTIMNNQTGIFINYGGGTYQDNTIKDNSIYGLYNYGTSVINAVHCDWGDPSGPYDPSDDRATGGLYNPNGKGNQVSDHVNYDPWSNMAPIVPGDVNHDDIVNLDDAILILKVLTGIPPSQPVFSDADINHDGRLGIEEVMYILQKVAKVR
jgi:parallel beta-helix repeat protein